jgi:ferredoxin-NADP reductase
VAGSRGTRRTPARCCSERSRVPPLTVTFLYTRASRSALAGAAGPQAAGGNADAAAPRVYAGRLNRGVLAETAFLPQSDPATFICGPTGFVEAASDLLVKAGYAPGTIKTERFGATS